MEKSNMQKINITKENILCSHVKADIITENHEEVLRVEKNEKLDIFDENTYVIIKDIKLHNGIIQVKMLSRLLPDAPDFARGFIGIVFRVNEKGSEFESYYIRPTNGNHPDPIRHSHGSQYFSYPGYTFAYFREHNIQGYEAPIQQGLNEWVTLKAIIEDDKASFYINGQEEPTLVVNDLKHGVGEEGYLGFYVDTGTEAFFKDLEIEIKD